MEDITAKQSKNEKIEEFLRDRYNFRFNIIKSRTEYQSDCGQLFKPVTRFHLNSMRREVDSSLGVVTSAENIRTILESDFAERVNPVQEYFRNLPRSDSRRTLESLAESVTVANSQYWLEYLTKWLVGVVANVMNDIGCQNHVCLVLTGGQGKYKTTWLDNLCPKSLKSYLFTGKIDPQSKDVLTLIAECLFINIDDQLKTLNKRGEDDLKNLITAPAIKYRRPYDVYFEDYPHLASFMASINGTTFLTDPSGSRRFLPFEVVDVDIEAAKRINIDDLYSEVVAIYDSGYRYWFNDDEINELHKQSSSFHVQTTEYEMLLQGFEKPLDGSSFMTTSQILNYLKEHSTLKLSEKRMGEALHKAGFERRSKRLNSTPVYGWVIQKIEPNPFL